MDQESHVHAHPAYDKLRYICMRNKINWQSLQQTYDAIYMCKL